MPTARGGRWTHVQVRQLLDCQEGMNNPGGRWCEPSSRPCVSQWPPATLLETICIARCSVPTVKATWEITITCRDASRLRFSELRNHAPQKGEIVQTVGGGPIIKAKIESFHEQPKAGAGPALFQVIATEI